MVGSPYNTGYMPYAWQPIPSVGPMPMNMPGVSSFSATPTNFNPGLIPMNGPEMGFGDMMGMLMQMMTMLTAQFQGLYGGGQPGYNPLMGGTMSSFLSQLSQTTSGATGGGYTDPGSQNTETGDTPDPGNTGGNGTVNMKFVEVGQNGQADQHTNEVQEDYNNTLGNNGSSNSSVSILGSDGSGLPPGAVEMPSQFQSQNDLDQYIDSKTTYALAEMTQQVNDTQSGVVNASLGWTRDSMYMDTIKLLKEQPKLRDYLGLSNADFSKIDFNDPKTIPPDIRKAVVQYVDNRMAPDNSAYSKALKAYQDATQQAAEQRHVMIVVSTANDGNLRDIFTSAEDGQDSNFLMFSKYVISVAASDTHGTADPSDDTIADFSSYGNGNNGNDAFAFNPTLAADGVNVHTSYGDVNGTSFSSPEVAATITRMLEANPNLTFDQIKQILQKTAVDTSASNLAEGAGMLDADKAVAMAQNYTG